MLEKTLLEEIKNQFVQNEKMDLNKYEEDVLNSIKEGMSDDEIYNIMILRSLERVSMEEPDWTYVASKVFLDKLYKEAKKNRGDLSFSKLIDILIEKGIYNKNVFSKYTDDEIKELEQTIDFEKDKLLTYLGLKTLADRYLAVDHDENVYELPQERFMVIAMELMQDENKDKRLGYVKEAYWALSNLYMTVATPTLANSGKTYGQLSSCFIGTMEDDLLNIYDANTDLARLSKAGGGLAVYMGKVRSKGARIKGFKNKSSGVISWMKNLNATAVAVDQLGTRKGSIAVYLDVWHKDIRDFLDSKLNNGDERKRTHDLYHGVCIPDLFMKQVEKRGKWYLFDPHEVRQVMGWSLEDFYDEVDDGEFTKRYWQCVNDDRLTLKEEVNAIDIMKRIMISCLETGTPYLFFRDTVNRMNPNKHKGMIYCSNLCSEICQNMSPTMTVEETLDGDEIIIRKKAGDFVVCNLSSISLSKAVKDGVLERLIPIQVRMLDNVIDLNQDKIEVKQAVRTNQKYRAIGLGTSGYHQLLANVGIQWETDKAVEFSDKLYEKIAFLAIKASMELAKEKGTYPLFEGSEWHTGKYFERRGYDSPEWLQLKEEVAKYGIRNGYLMAVAPTGSTSFISNSTASIDPIFKKEYVEVKRGFRIPVVVPDLSPKTMWYYKPAHQIDQLWSVKQNAARARHIDQSISFNIYVPANIHARKLLEIYMESWKSGVKTIYYTRTASTMEIEDCESCSS